MTVREARPEDAPGVVALFAELGYPAAPGAVAVRIGRFAADPSSCFLVAEDERGLGGLASASVMPLAQEDGGWCRLSAVVVAAGRRRSGIGRALVEAVEAFAGANGCALVEVTSGERPEREAAHRFYADLGYEEVSKRYLKSL